MVYKVTVNIDQNMVGPSSVISADFTPNQYSQNGRYLLEGETLMNEIDWTVTILGANVQTPSANLRLYGCKVLQGGVLYLELVPCYRKSDGVVGMYDLVNDVFYTNQGNGTFAKGSDIGGSIENSGVLSVNGQTGNVTIPAGSEIVYCTQAQYDALPSSKLTDGKSYVIYE